MKKYFIIAVAAIAAMAACTKVDPVNNTTKDTAISFSVINHLHQTKATAGLTYPTDVPFGTFAWWTADNWTGVAADQDFVFMDNEQVVYKQLEAAGPYVWAPNSAYYWTKSGKLTFASYSPYVNATTASEKGFSAIPAHDPALGFQFTDYTIVAGTNVDLMYANLAKDCTQQTNATGTEVTDSSNPEGGFSGVPTIFNHALCQIGFEFRAIGNKNPNVSRIVIDITDVDILNIDNKGSFVQNPAANSARWTTNHANNKADYEYAPASTMSLELIEANATTLPATDNYTALGTTRILMPQALVVTTDTNTNLPVDPAPAAVTDQKLVVKYTIKTEYTSKPNEWATESVVSTVRLNNGSISAWKENQNITYRISINPYATLPITFDPAVLSWEDVYSDNIDIIVPND